MQSVLRSFRVLETVADHQPIGVADVARIVELPTSTVQRILVTLRDAGWIASTDEALTRWTMTPRALAVGRKAVPETGLLQAAALPVRQLCDATQETIHLSVPDGVSNVVIVDRTDPEQAVRTYVRVGFSSPIHATSSGRSILAAMSDEAVEEVISRGLSAVTDKTLTEPERFRQEIKECRDKGYAVNVGENRPNVTAFAAAVLEGSSRPIAAVAISMPSHRFDHRLTGHWGDLVMEAASQISIRLGY